MVCYCCTALCIFGVFVLYKILDRLVRIPFIGGLSDKYIFITGCDTGFGHEAAKKLDGMGCNVFAGCFTEKGEDELRKQCSSRLKTVSLDVSNRDSIKRAAEFVTRNLPSGKGLHGVVNNAGVAGRFVGPVEWLQRSDYDEMMAINLYGVIETSLALLPLVKKANGRFVNTASVFGRFSLLGNVPYSVAKFGVEAFSDSLRREMRPFGVTIHIIEPGFHKTNIADPRALSRALEASWDRLPLDTKEEYGEEFLRKTCDDVISKRIADMCSERIHDVVDGYVHALLGRCPRARYVIGKDAKFFWLPIQFIPEWLGDKILELVAGPGRPVPIATKRR